MKKSVLPRAFSLVEVTLAIGIAAFCLIGIFALLPMGALSNRDSVSTTHAASLAEAVVADLRNTESGKTSLLYTLQPDAAGATNFYLNEDGSKAASADAADYQASVTISPPASGLIAPTQIRVVLSWPAGAPSPVSQFEIVSALDRN